MTPTLSDLPHFARLRPEPGKRAAWAMAVVVHVLLAVFLIYGVQWQSSAPETISVDLVRYAPPAVAEKPPTPVQEQKQPEPVPPKVEKAEPPAPIKAEILRKDPEKPKPAKKLMESVDAATDWIKRETERMTRIRNVDAADRALEQLKATQAASSRNKGLVDYLSKVRSKIRGNIVLPPAIAGNPESVFVVTQLPSGEVLSVKLKTPSGNSALDAAVERAILKSSPLPKPDDPSLFERELSIKYRPLDD